MQQSEVCAGLETLVLKIKENQNFIKSRESVKGLEDNKRKLETKKGEYETNYVEFREDYKAGLSDYNNRLSSIDMKSIRQDYENILNEIKTVDVNISQQLTSIDALPEVLALKQYVSTHKKDFLNQVESYEFWYPAYVTIMQIILILPLLLLSLALYQFSLKRRLRILSILSSNLSFIT